MEKMVYTSECFTNSNGSPREFIIPISALSTYMKRDVALKECMKLGGIHAAVTPTFMKFHRSMMSAKRKIAREGWFCTLAN